MPDRRIRQNACLPESGIGALCTSGPQSPLLLFGAILTILLSPLGAHFLHAAEPPAGAEESVDFTPGRDVALLTKEKTILVGRLLGYDGEGYLLLEQPQEVLRVSPLVLRGLFTTLEEARRARSDPAWLDEEEKRFDQALRGPGAKTEGEPRPLTQRYLSHPNQKEDERDDSDFRRSMEEARRIVEHYAREGVLRDELQRLRPVLTEEAGDLRLFLQPKTYRPALLFAAALLEARMRLPLLRLMKRHVDALAQSDLSSEEKETVRRRLRLLFQEWNLGRGADEDEDEDARPEDAPDEAGANASSS